VVLVPVPVVLSQNLLSNPDFEAGTTSWAPFGSCLVSADAQAHSGSYAGCASSRTEYWMGIHQSVLGVLQDSHTYRISAWVRLRGAANDQAGITIKQVDGQGTQYYNATWSTARSDRWMFRSGIFTLNVVGELTELTLYFSGPQPGVDLLIDDAAAIEIDDWKSDADARIEEIRKRDCTITVLSPADIPVSNAVVELYQTSHDFAFGSCIDANLLDVPQYADFFRNHFEWATPENETKWPHNEPTQGSVSYEDAEKIWAFCSSNGIAVRGTCAFWARETEVQDWVKALDTNALRSAVETRLHDVVGHFKGRFVHWDVNNEMLDNSFYKDRLGAWIRPWMYQKTRTIDPACRLFVNEYSIIAYDGFSLARYEDQIIDLQLAGMPIDAVGVQGHCSSNFVREGIWDRFDNLAQLGKPIWVTEYDSPNTNEVQRADNLEHFFRIAFSHPAVRGILIWGFWEDAMWREDCHLVNLDWSLNEAGRRYEDLMREWTTVRTNQTDSLGKAVFRGFHGSYRVVTKSAEFAATTNEFDLPAGGSTSHWVITMRGTDSDGDLLWDEWEHARLGGLQQTWTNDPDGDGMHNLGEWTANTDPTNRTSVLRVTGVSEGQNGVRIDWQGGTWARQYAEYAWRPDATNGEWVVVFTNEPPTSTQTNLIHAGTTNQSAFYRIRARRQ